MEHLEDVVHAGHHLHVGAVGIHGAREVVEGAVGTELAGQVEEAAVGGVPPEQGVVFVGEGAPEGVHTEKLAPFEFAEQGNAVEELSVEVPREHDRGIAVVEELHVVDEAEVAFFLYIGEVGGGHDEQREGNAVPLHAALELGIDFAPGVEPEAFVDGGFGEVVDAVKAKAAVVSDGVREAVYGCVAVGGYAPLLGVDPVGAGLIAQFEAEVAGAQPAPPRSGVGRRRAATVEGLIEKGGRGLVVLRAQLGLEAQTVGPLAVPEQAEGLVVHHVVDGGPLEGSEHVVLVGGQELVAGRHHIAAVAEGEIVDGKLTRQEGLGGKGIGDFAHALPAMILEAIGYVALEEPVAEEVGRGLRGGAEAEPVDEVLRNHGVDGPDVDFRGAVGVGGGLHVVLDESLGHEEHGFEAAHLLESADKELHLVLAVAETRGPAGLPESGIAQFGVGLGTGVALEVEVGRGQGGEGEVAVLVGARHLELLQEVDEGELHEHVVATEHLSAAGQFGELLYDAHVLHKVDVGVAGNADVGSFHAPRGVGQDIKRARKAHILRVVGREVHADAAVGAHLEGVDNEIAVEAYGAAAAERTGEVVLEEADVVVEDVDIGEHIAQHGGEYVAGAEKAVDTHAAVTGDDALLGGGTAAVELAADGFLHGYGQHELAGFVAHLDMLLEEGHLLEFPFLKDLVRHLVEGESELRVLVHAEVVVLLRAYFFLGGNDLFHKLHGGIVLTRVFLATAGDDSLGKGALVGHELHVDPPGRPHADGLGGVADAGEAQAPLAERHTVAALLVGLRGGALVVGHVDEGQPLAGARVGDDAADGLGRRSDDEEKEQYEG